MKKRFAELLSAVVVAGIVLTGCSQSSDKQEAAQTDNEAIENSEESDGSASEASSDENEVAADDVEEQLAENEEASEENDETSEENDEVSDQSDIDESGESNEEATDVAGSASEYEVARIGSLKGPTTMGIVNLMNASDNGESIGTYEFTMATQPDELVASVVSGDIDIAMVPANVASVLYNKTDGGISLVDINTLGVLYCVTGDESVKSIADLSGKTVITTGQGATPEYALNYLLEQNGITDCTIEFKSEATEIAALLQEDSTKIAVLPEPFVTVATLQNNDLKTAFGLTDEWANVTSDSKLITGVTVVRNEYLSEHPEEVRNFLKEHEESAQKAVDDVDTTAELVASYGIIEKKEVAAKAIPGCNIVCISGDNASKDLSGYLQTLFDADPKSVGGALPGDDFYKLSD